MTDLNDPDNVTATLAALAAATSSTEKSAIITEMNLDDLPPTVTLAARRAVILHWFNAEVLAALLPADSDISAADAYRHLADRPFIEHLPYGLTYHSLNREGLLAQFTVDRPDLLRQAAALAAPVYAAVSRPDPLRPEGMATSDWVETHHEHKTFAMEALYCYTLAGDATAAVKLLEDLLFWNVGRQDWAAVLQVFAIRDEAEGYSFVSPLPRSALHHFAAGLAHIELEMYEAAVADFSEAIRLNPAYTNAYNSRGVSYYRQGQHEAAVADFSEAIRLDPAYATPYHNRGLAFAQLNQDEAANADFNKAIELRPADKV